VTRLNFQKLSYGGGLIWSSRENFLKQDVKLVIRIFNDDEGSNWEGCSKDYFLKEGIHFDMIIQGFTQIP